MNFEVDQSALDTIRALRSPGKPDILARMVSLYLAKTPDLLSEIEDGIAADDAPRVRKAAHTLKSSSAYLGATGMAAECRVLEELAVNGDLSVGHEHLKTIKTGFESVAEQIHDYQDAA